MLRQGVTVCDQRVNVVAGSFNFKQEPGKDRQNCSTLQVGVWQGDDFASRLRMLCITRCGLWQYSLARVVQSILDSHDHVHILSMYIAT